MNDFVEDQEDRTRGFVPPEPRGLGMRWIALAVAAVFAAVIVVTKVVPPAHDGQPAAKAAAAEAAK
ncbi:MAG TPA: hypothetical protein VFM98_12100 [Ramlibacter sp.]|uniref:hypothetical protein n=1 Tax=Ramlibacter sp. TaxID=1917967 RepID=UPI002D7F18A8|nr:hypothetical protein [Ramlibacter sp.]HET8746341.1 hypothetical protein [Ramlibacter sp.]